MGTAVGGVVGVACGACVAVALGLGVAIAVGVACGGTVDCGAAVGWVVGATDGVEVAMFSLLGASSPPQAAMTTNSIKANAKETVTSSGLLRGLKLL